MERNILHRSLLATLFLFVGLAATLAQVATRYTWSQAAGTYAAVGAAGSDALFPDGWDDNQAVVTIPFNFTFDGAVYTQVVVSSNGFLVFGGTLNANNTGEAFVSGTDASGLYLGGTGTDNGVAAFNADLDEVSYTGITGRRTSGSTTITNLSSTTNLRVGMRLEGNTGIPADAVITSIAGTTLTLSSAATSGSNSNTNLTPRANAVAVVSGSAPNRTLTIQWTRITRYQDNDDASFQIQLNEGGGAPASQAISVAYGTCTSAENNNNDPVQVGIRTTTSDYNSRTTTTSTNWTATTAGAANTDRVRFRNTYAPTSGRTYTWTPVFCSGMPTAGSISGTSPICSGSSTTLTLSGQSTIGYGLSTSWTYGVTPSSGLQSGAGSGLSISTGNLAAARYYTAKTTCSNGGGIGTTAEYAVLVTPQPTVSNAGPDQSSCSTSPAVTLAANTGTGTGAWSLVSGPSMLLSQFSSTAANNATFTPAGGVGVYTLRWTISNAPCTASTDDVVITVAGTPTASAAGPDQNICVTGSATLAANNPGTGTGAWSVVSGPSLSSAQFGNTAVRNTAFTPAGGLGTYTLRWTISNNPCTASTDDVVISTTAAPTTSNAGPDQSSCISSPAVTLAANTGTGTGAWSMVSGPSMLLSQFSSTAANNATFTPVGGAGTYTLRWTISNAPCTASTNDVAITVAGTPTISAAGPDQNICVTGSATLAANNPGTGTGGWSVVSGPSLSSGQFGSVAVRNTTFTPAGGLGTYTLRWTISNNPCTASMDDVVISTTAAPTASNAGGDQSICTNATATLAANSPGVGVGAWSVVAGSPSTSTAQFSSTAANSATFTPAGGAGTYTLRWTVSNAPCTASTDDVVVTVNAQPAVPTMTPTSASICQGGSTGLSASLPNVTTSVSGGAITLNFNNTASPYPSAVVVSGLPTSGATVASVSINGVTHSNPDDIDMVLRSPTGTYVVVMSDVGGTGNIAGNN
ncbi:MAG: hypothetical protein ABI432_09965, partial [Flavobacteriales bacterium]